MRVGLSYNILIVCAPLPPTAPASGASQRSYRYWPDSMLFMLATEWYAFSEGFTISREGHNKCITAVDEIYICCHFVLLLHPPTAGVPGGFW